MRPFARASAILHAVLVSPLLPAVWTALFLLLYASHLFLPALGAFRDDGIYISSARSLVRGNGYSIDILPGSPPNTKYPPLTSWLLAPAFLLYGDAALPPACALKAPVFLFLPLWLVALWILARQLGLSPTAAAWLLACTVSSCFAGYLAVMPLSDVPFAAIATGSLVLITRPGSQTAPCRNCWWLAVTGALLCLVRAQGAAIVAGGIAALLLARRFRAALLFFAGAACSLLAWFAWQQARGVPAEPLLLYYSAANYRHWWIWRADTWADALNTLATNALAAAATPMMSVGLTPIWLAILAGAGLWGFALRATTLHWSRLRSLALPLAPMVALVLCWQWPPARMLLAVVPCLFLALALPPYRPWQARLLSVAAFAYTATGFHHALQLHQYALRDGNPPLSALHADRWEPLAKLGLWLRHHAPPNAIVGALQDSSIALLSTRPALLPARVRPASLFYGSRAPALGSVAELRHAIQRASIHYLVLTPSAMFAEAPHWRHLVTSLAHPDLDLIEKVYEPEPGYVIYRVRQLPHPPLATTAAPSPVTPLQ
jgi:hypothetical protein